MPDLRPEFFRRIDESEDEQFYQSPRLVTHINDGAIARAREIYARLLPADGAILDLMSSWRSHLPADLNPRRVVGLGLNRAEMADNPALTEIAVHNVNRDPRLPFDDSSFDGAVMTVSVQYLTQPIAVFAEAGRVLKPGAPFVITFSNRMFPTKAIALWQQAHEDQRVMIVESYFVRSGAFDQVQVIDRGEPAADSQDAPADPLWAVAGLASHP
jgi:SAM-dependent methyltransferase